MSGGVDSSVAAALLVEQGHEVIGVTMHLAGSSSRCCSLDDADDARRVAERLGIRFYVAELQGRASAREVIEPFADAYLAGRTPIPCVACNRSLQVRSPARARARARGRRRRHRPLRAHRAQRRRARGSCAAAIPPRTRATSCSDLRAEQLAHAHFPVGDAAQGRRSATARARARSRHRRQAREPGDLLRARRRLRPRGGADPARGARAARRDRRRRQRPRRSGAHAGVHHFTVGQRRGLSGGREPRSTCAASTPRANRVLVGGAAELARRGARLEGVRWIARTRRPAQSLRAEVAGPLPTPGRGGAHRAAGDGGARVRFDAPVRAVAPGQAAVFYARRAACSAAAGSPARWTEAPVRRGGEPAAEAPARRGAGSATASHDPALLRDRAHASRPTPTSTTRATATSASSSWAMRCSASRWPAAVRGATPSWPEGHLTRARAALVNSARRSPSAPVRSSSEPTRASGAPSARGRRRREGAHPRQSLRGVRRRGLSRRRPRARARPRAARVRRRARRRRRGARARSEDALPGVGPRDQRRETPRYRARADTGDRGGRGPLQRRR